jgi:hypothetical protein
MSLRANSLPLLVGLSISLVAPAAADDPWNPNAVYAAREAQLRHVVEANPRAAQPLVDLAAFYLKPLAPRRVAAADGQIRLVMVPLRSEQRPGYREVYGAPWVFRGDPDLARPLIKKALEIEPKNAGAIRAMALTLRMTRGTPSDTKPTSMTLRLAPYDFNGMKPYVDAALAHHPLDLDMCRLYLEYYFLVAQRLNEAAGDLRMPHSHYETRWDGRYLVTVPPGAGDLARADELEARAKADREDGEKPLHRLAGALQADPDRPRNPAKNATWHLATAIHFSAINDLGKAAGTAGLALKADPTDLDALDFIVDVLRSTHTLDKLPTYKAILDRWEGADSSPVLIHDAPRGVKR